MNGKTVTSSKVDNECITFKVEFKVPKAHSHTSSGWKTDDTNHWKVCTDSACGTMTVAKEAHKDTNKDNKCDVCRYAIPKSNNTTSTPDSVPSTDKPTSSSVSNEPVTSNPSDSKSEETNGNIESESKDIINNDKEDEDNKEGILIWIILGSVVLLAVGGAVIFVVLKKKQNN